MRDGPELVSYPLCPYVQRAAIVLLEKEVPFRRREINLADKPDWFRALSPLGKVPLLRLGEEVLVESSVICDYLDEVTAGSLYPEDPLAKAQLRGWAEFAASILNDIGGLYNAGDRAGLNEKTALIRMKFERLENHLQGPWFAGGRFTMADAAFATVFRYFDVIDPVADFGLFTGLEALNAWRSNLAGRSSVRQAVAADYEDELRAFLKRRPSYLKGLIEAQDLAA